LKTLIVVSGGDAPGINTAIYHYSTLAAAADSSAIGALGGFPGALQAAFVTLTPALLTPWAGVSGSFLPSSRDPVLAQDDAQLRLKTVLDQHKIDNILLFGGNGTLRHIPPLLAEWQIPCMGIPTTIDNDVPGTEETLGFDSACNFAYSVIDGIRATGHALPGRLFTLETLGGNTGFLALEIARAAGADAVLLPEYSYDIAHICERLRVAVEHKGHALVIYGEGLPDKSALLEAIPQLTGIRVRPSHLGHAQRGGTPTHRDRALAADSARQAFHAFLDGTAMGVLVVREGRLQLHQGLLADSMPKVPNLLDYQRINGLS
jgi:6-phosphofructokinase 1